ncbi:MAG: glycoside hydrolase family 140 protein [Planctomycetaceae bacterium]|jgi:hypothetical protein|nr:glycoside hydrolase family 140 protein [Planctomycetaceae bacterium]
MRTLFLLLVSLFLFLAYFCLELSAQEKQHVGLAWNFSHGQLKVAADCRTLVHEDETPFLWLGDTAWEMFHRLRRDEVDFYLEKRRSQGFTVIQAVALAEFDGLTRPTPGGHLPLLDNDPAQPDVKDGPDNDYWDDVDFMVTLAEQKGLYIAMLPTWGDKVIKKWRGVEIFTPENAEKYGFFIGQRYGACKNIIWVLGGDRPCERENDYAVWRAMVKGIKNGEKTAKNGFVHLMTYHPMGMTSSSKWFHKDDWLDFNMFQSGHSEKDRPNYKMTAHDYELKPPKPVIDGEPRYENHPIRGDKTHTQWFDDVDVRQAAYWGIFSGCFGHTYGCHDIWMMYDGTKERQCADARTSWKDAVDLPGAWQMLYLRQLLLEGQLLEIGRTPCQELIVGDNPDDAGHFVACCSQDRKRAYIYIPTGRRVELDLTKLNLNSASSFSWYNPRTGKTVEMVLQPDKTQSRVYFDPPGKEERGNDWVLIVR